MEAEKLHDHFMKLLLEALDSTIDSSGYEDSCRALLGTSSYQLFTLDKLVHKLVKHMQSMLQVRRAWWCRAGRVPCCCSAPDACHQGHVGARHQVLPGIAATHGAPLSTSGSPCVLYGCVVWLGMGVEEQPQCIMQQHTWSSVNARTLRLWIEPTARYS